MNQQEPTSEDPSAPSEPDSPVSAVSQQGTEGGRPPMPPHWALGYHEVYDEWPCADDLLRRDRRFTETDTPLASVQLPAEAPPSRQTSIKSITDRLHEHDIRLSAPFSKVAHRAPGQASEADRVPSPNPTPGRPEDADRQLFFTDTAGEQTPPDVAVTIPVRFGSRASLQRLISRSLDISSRGFPLCGPEFQNIESADPERAIRWIQFAALLPLIRVRMTSLPSADSSLWPFPPEVTRTWRRYLGFRQKLFPYLYSTFDIYRQTGQPPIRKVEAPVNDPASTPDDRILSLGPALAIAPVDDGDTDHRSIRLPEGQWFHFWTNDPYMGGRADSVPASTHHIPVFARGGSVIPLHPFRRRLDGTTPNTLVLRAYPRSGRMNAVYTDDGHTHAYENGDYHRLIIDTQQNGNRFVLHLSQEGDRGLPYDYFEWQVPAHLTKSAAIEGHELPVYSVPEKFVDADEGILRGHNFLRIRTPATVPSLEVELKSSG